MPQVTRSRGVVRVSSTGRGEWSTTGSVTWTLDLSEIMDGSTVNSAIISLSVDGYGASELSLGSGQKIGITNVRTATFDITSLFARKTEYTADDALVFYFTSYYETWGETWRNEIQGYGGGDIVLTITYTLPYTACTPPTEVTAADTDVAPGATVRVSWDGAEGGTNNPIVSYTVYRSTDGVSWDVLQTGVENEYLDVTAPAQNGAVYHYAVMSVGTVDGYSSGKSAASASVRCLYSAPSVSAVKLDSGTANVYKLAGSTATLSWTGSAGTNNPIAKYRIHRNGSYLSETTSSFLTVDAPPAGGNYYYSVTPVGAYSKGDPGTSPTLYAYSNPVAPQSVTLSKTEAGKQEQVRLSWTGAAPGALNAITGYRVYRSTSLNGTYSQLGQDIPGTGTGGYLIVTSPASNGSYYYYKVATIGAHSVSGMSDSARLRTVWTAPTVGSLTLSADTVAPGGSSVLRFSVHAGTNNPVTGIEIYQDEELIDTLPASAESYDVTAGASAGDEVDFQILPLGTWSDGSLSDAVTLRAYGAPTAPSSVSVSDSTPDAGTLVVLSWSGAEDGDFNPIARYGIYRAASSGGDYELIDTVMGSGAFVNVPGAMGASYWYKVQAIGQYSSSPLSSSVQVTAKVYTAPGAPVASVSPSQAGMFDDPVLSWTAAADGTNNPVTGYRVYRSDRQTGTYERLGQDLSAETLSIHVSAPEAMGASYYYRVYALAARSGYSISPASNTVCLTSLVYTACGIPGDVSISSRLSNPGDTVTISWSAAANGTNNPVSGYCVYRNTVSGFDIYVITTDLSVTDTVGDSGATASYKVRAIGTIPGFDGQDSASVTVVSNSPPGAIGRLTQPDQYYEGGGMRISWIPAQDPNDNIAYYELDFRVRTAPGEEAEWSAWTPVMTVSEPDVLLYPDVERGYQFQYRIRAVDSLGLAGPWAGTRRYIRNQLPLVPSVILPASGMTSYNTRPYIVVSLSADPDGHSQYIDLSIDDNDFIEVLDPGFATGRMAIRCHTDMSVGDLHLVKIRSRDALGAVSAAVSLYIRVERITWAREIARGIIISRAGSQYIGEDLSLFDGEYDEDEVTVNNGTWSDVTLLVDDSGGISHQEEIRQMYAYVNTGRAYYAMDPLEIPDLVGAAYAGAGEGKIGMFAAWGAQMSDLYQAMAEIEGLLGVVSPVLTITDGMMPTAGIINGIRGMIENM